ncbi:hypothetical protein HD806DRAFT_548363 [Xylariaceae sp. AK1471]|nr:hypothetical protein HD806DRAFT_548363 [Xylariaceae sp. AK1471]
MTPAPLPPQGTTVSVEAPWHCLVESLLTKTEQGRTDFRNLTVHVAAPRCKCRRSPNPDQENTNEETVSRHCHNLWDSGKCDPVQMMKIFANLKFGLPVKEEFELLWEEEKKSWNETPRKEERGPGNRSPSKNDWSFAGQVSSRHVPEPEPKS